jgi:L-ascorbate metabolism protein UlaG (beta-lactamase superfamily)
MPTSPASGERLERIHASPQYRDGRFHNPAAGIPRDRYTGDGSMIGEFFFGGGKRRPPGPLPVESPLEAWQRAPGGDLRITWLGHSTTLIESGGLRVLTDPVFGDRVGPVSFAGPRRYHPVPVTIAQLPPLDAILVSHDHFDHLCRPSMLELARLGVPVVTSLGVGARLERFGVQTITELDWWERHVMAGGDLAFTAVPAHHFSGRSLTDRNRTLWSSWVIQTPRHQVFFSGDTGPHAGFRTIGERFGGFDVTMLEIGAWNPAWADIHLGPAAALAAFDELGGGTLLPIHWGTFDLGLHPWAEPAEQLFELAHQSRARFLTPTLGRPFLPAHADSPAPWWRAVDQGAAQNAAAHSPPGPLQASSAAHSAKHG